MTTPSMTLGARTVWGNFPHVQASIELTSGTAIGASLSGYLIRTVGAAALSIGSVPDGVSYVFDSQGSALTVSLPASEQTTGGETAVVIEGVGSLTRAQGKWTYAG